MSTIVIPTSEQWSVLEALGLTGGGTGFLIVHPDTARELRGKYSLNLSHGQVVKFSTPLGEDDLYITFVDADHWIADALVEELDSTEDDESDDEPAEG